MIGSTEALRALLDSLSGIRENLEQSLTELREHREEHSPFRYLMAPEEQSSGELQRRG